MKRRLKPGQPSEHEIDAKRLPSASGFDSEFRCPGKRALILRLPREEDSASALQGKRIHAALEKSDLDGLSKSESRTTSRIMYGEAEMVHEYSFEGAEVEFEHRIWDHDEELNPIWSARIDTYHWQPDKKRLLVPDYKTGWGLPVPIADNWQVRSEAALLTERLGAEEAVVALIHPHHPDSLWEAKVLRRKELLEILDLVRHNVAAIQLPDQPRIPGGIQCQWCLAKRICPEYIAASAALDQAIADEIADEGFTAIIRRSVSERGEHVRRLKEQMKNIGEILEQYVQLMERDGSSIDGWQLRRKLDRAVTSEVEAMRLTREQFGEEAVYAALKFSVAALEEQIAPKVGGLRKAKEIVGRVLSSVIVFKKSKNFLAESRSL
jgi:hypothetical protein